MRYDHECEKCDGHGCIERKYCDCSLGQLLAENAKHVAVAHNHETGKKEVFADTHHAGYPVEMSSNLFNRREERIVVLIAALKRAKQIIRDWHGMGMVGETEQIAWDAYQHSPEMKQINAALESDAVFDEERDMEYHGRERITTC